MKRLLLVSLVGLSLVGCSNEINTEIPIQDTKPTLEEQRLQSQKRLREEHTAEYKQAEKKVSEYTLKYGSPDTSYTFSDGSTMYIWDGMGKLKSMSVLVPAK